MWSLTNISEKNEMLVVIFSIITMIPSILILQISSMYWLTYLISIGIIIMGFTTSYIYTNWYIFVLFYIKFLFKINNRNFLKIFYINYCTFFIWIIICRLSDTNISCLFISE